VKASWNPWYRGWKTVFNVRGIGTNWENPYLWPGIKYTWQAQKPCIKAKDPDAKLLTTRHNLTARGRWSGVAIRCGYIMLNFFLLAAYYEFMDPQVLLSIPPSSSDYTRDKEGIVRRLLQTYLTSSGPATPVTAREFQLRALEAFDKVVGDFLLISLYHDTCAVVWMCLGLDESWEWPPVYGRIQEAYSMRRFWNMFWHRTFYKSANSHAALIMRHIFGIRRRTAFTRFLNAFLVFGMSGVMHSMVQTRLGHPCAWGRNLWYWALQPVAFVLEGIVQFFWGKVRRMIAAPGNAWALNALWGTLGCALG
jgi:glycosyltransferase involved in cell wall biosynthesis